MSDRTGNTKTVEAIYNNMFETKSWKPLTSENQLFLLNNKNERCNL